MVDTAAGLQSGPAVAVCNARPPESAYHCHSSFLEPRKSLLYTTDRNPDRRAHASVGIVRNHGARALIRLTEASPSTEGRSLVLDWKAPTTPGREEGPFEVEMNGSACNA